MRLIQDVANPDRFIAFQSVLPATANWPTVIGSLSATMARTISAGSQLDAVYGPLQGKAIRDVTPQSLVMYGSHERDVMESAAFFSGKTTRSHQSYATGTGDTTTGRQFGNVLGAAELLPLNTSEARLIPRGRPGQMVELIGFAEFVVYLDELRAAQPGRASPACASRLRHGQPL